MRDALLRIGGAVLLCGWVAGAAHAGPDTVLRLTLAEAVARATGGTASVTLADLHEREARSRSSQSFGSLLPTLSGSTMFSNRTFNLKSFGIRFPTAPGAPGLADLQGPVDLFDARLRLTQTVFDPASWARLGAARRAVDQAHAERTSASELSAQNAANAYLRAVRARAVVGARAADSTVAGQLVELADAQERAGTTPKIEATRARTQLVAAEGALLVARNQFDRAIIDLARTLALPPQEPLELADTLSAELGASDAPGAATSAVAFAMSHRPDLAVERTRLARARADRSAIRWERAGHIDAAADYGASGTDVSNSIATREMSVAWNVPILDGLRREQRLAEQDLVLRESEVRAEDLEQQVSADVNGALLDLASGRGQQVVAAERLELAAQELDQARARFRGGLAGSLELVNAESSLVRARDADIDARFAIASAHVAMARASGVASNLH